MPYLDQIPSSNLKSVVLRLDLNLPIDYQSSPKKILDLTRLQAALPTLQYLKKQAQKVYLVSHLGRPKGQANPDFSLKILQSALQKNLQVPVSWAPHHLLNDLNQLQRDTADSQFVLLENIRFYQEEKANDPKLAQALARLAQIYVNDAFGVTHRAHASVQAAPQFFKQAAAGFLIKSEIQNLSKLLQKPKSPFCVLLGGAKLETKLPLIQSLLPKIDHLLVGGALSYPFLAARGRQLGLSQPAPKLTQQASEIINLIDKHQVKLHLPVDHQIQIGNQEISVNNNSDFPAQAAGKDLGPASIQHFQQILQNSQTTFWNGPLGQYENPNFAQATNQILQTIASSPAYKVSAGGDSVAVLQQNGLAKQFDHLSTGGGAALQFLGGQILPGLAALDL